MYKVLLVDDEQVVTENIKKLIPWEKYGIGHIAISANGFEAIEIVNQDKPDIVITDIKMPGMDGIQLIKQIRKNGHDVEFIILSGYGEFELAKSAMGQGVKSFLLKPCSEDEIISSLRNAISDLEQKRIRPDNFQYKRRDWNSEQAMERMEKLILLHNHDDLLLAVNEMMYHYDQDFVIHVFSQLLMKQLHKGKLSTLQLTRFFNGIHKTMNNQELATYIANSLEDMKDTFYEEGNFVTDIVKYVEENLDDEQLSLKWIAKEIVFLNEDYVSRSFVRQMGETFSAYLTGKRLERAKFLIRHLGKGKIYSVAEQVGFGHNPRYFSKLFKKHTGYTPKEYRKLTK